MGTRSLTRLFDEGNKIQGLKAILNGDETKLLAALVGNYTELDEYRVVYWFDN